MRVTNVLVGTITLVVIAAAVVGMLFARNIRSTQAKTPLRIVFDGSASGLRKGGVVNFDGVPAGEITSIKLLNPRKTVALLMLDKTAPIRKDTVVGIEFRGLTGVAAISLVGGAAGAPPVPLDNDGIPTLTADWREQQSIADTLHKADRLIVENEAALKDAVLSFETYSASLKGKGEALDSVVGKAEGAFTSFDNALTRIDRVSPGLADGKASELFEKVKEMREMAGGFRQKSATVMDEGRRTLQDISEAARKMSLKLEPQARLPVPTPRQSLKRR
ncbi:MAG: MCE family protein [Bradyrhizobium sp.]|nr:MCE family protein [Bradyrhizobium sp.]